MLATNIAENLVNSCFAVEFSRDNTLLLGISYCGFPIVVFEGGGCFFFFESGSHCIAQDGLKFAILPASASQDRIASMCQHAWS